MKYEKRQPYIELINMMPAGYGLCNFCKLAQWEGMSCCDSELRMKTTVIIFAVFVIIASILTWQVVRYIGG